MKNRDFVLHIQSTIMPPSPITWNNLLQQELAKDFQIIFGRRLAVYFHLYSGLDVVAFERFINPPDGVSIEDTVREKFGQKGVDICNRLLERYPKPGPIETWTDTEFDLSTEDTSGFEKCTFSFVNARGRILEGKGYYKKGILVHREFSGYEDKQMESGGFCISTIHGVLCTRGLSFKDAKIKASIMAQALDFEKAMTFNFTDTQDDAIRRVGVYWGKL